MEPTHSPGGGSESLGALRHRWWLVLLTGVVGVAAAGCWLAVRDPVWESSASVLVHPAGQDINVVGGRTQGQVNLDTEAQLVRSTAVERRAAERLGLDPALTARDELASQVSVEVPANTSVLMITFAARTPELAQAGSRAFAESYLEQREQAARAELSQRVAAIESRRDELAANLAEVNDRLTAALPGTATATNLESQRSTVTSQLNVLADRMNELGTATVSAGAIINEPQLPTEPSWPQPPVVLASGAALGLVAGVAVAGLAERLASRVRRPADLIRRFGLPVLADLRPSGGASMTAAEPVASPYGAAGRIFDRLRNEVLAAERARLAEPVAGTDRTGAPVIIVTSPGTDAASAPIALNLAASLARCGHEVALVAAGLSAEAGGSLARLLGVATSPGLSEVLAGRVSIAEALHRSPHHPRLHTMTIGGAGAAAGLLQSPALRTVLAAMASRTGYVVVAAPATASSADAQSLASHADAALLVVEARRNRLAQVADALGQLRGVGTPLRGAVLVPAGPRGADRPERAPAAPAAPASAAPASTAPASTAPASTAPVMPAAPVGWAHAAGGRPTGRPRPSMPPVPYHEMGHTLVFGKLDLPADNEPPRAGEWATGTAANRVAAETREAASGPDPR